MRLFNLENQTSSAENEIAPYQCGKVESGINKIAGAKTHQSATNFVFVRLVVTNPYVVRAFMEENGIRKRLFTEQDTLRLWITIGPRDIMERVLIQLKKASIKERSIL